MSSIKSHPHRGGRTSQHTAPTRRLGPSASLSDSPSYNIVHLNLTDRIAQLNMRDLHSARLRAVLPAHLAAPPPRRLRVGESRSPAPSPGPAPAPSRRLYVDAVCPPYGETRRTISICTSRRAYLRVALPRQAWAPPPSRRLYMDAACPPLRRDTPHREHLPVSCAPLNRTSPRTRRAGGGSGGRP